MPTSDLHGRWYCLPGDLVEIDAIRARDLLVECFYHAKREELARGHAVIGLEATEDQLHMQAEGFVRTAFRRTGGDFNSPDRASLEAALESLAETAAHYGTPQDIITHHVAEMSRVFDAIR